MNLTFKIHGGILLSTGVTSLTDVYYGLIDNSANLDAGIPGYPYHELAMLDHSEKYCPTV
jgi:hypothetical protein